MRRGRPSSSGQRARRGRHTRRTRSRSASIRTCRGGAERCRLPPIRTAAAHVQPEAVRTCRADDRRAAPAPRKQKPTRSVTTADQSPPPESMSVTISQLASVNCGRRAAGSETDRAPRASLRPRGAPRATARGETRRSPTRCPEPAEPGPECGDQRHEGGDRREGEEAGGDRCPVRLKRSATAARTANTSSAQATYPAFPEVALK